MGGRLVRPSHYSPAALRRSNLHPCLDMPGQCACRGWTGVFVFARRVQHSRLRTLPPVGNTLAARDNRAMVDTAVRGVWICNDLGNIVGVVASTGCLLGVGDQG